MGSPLLEPSGADSINQRVEDSRYLCGPASGNRSGTIRIVVAVTVSPDLIALPMVTPSLSHPLHVEL